jgi:hypothetical protein
VVTSQLPLSLSGFFSGAKPPGTGADHPPHLTPSSAKIKAIAVLPICGVWRVMGKPLPLQVTVPEISLKFVDFNLQNIPLFSS